MRGKSLFLVAAIIVSWSALISADRANAQSASSTSAADRKVSTRTAPNYPELAKKMHIHGLVRIEALVRPNGSVKSTRVLGGNPVLVDAAQEAVSKWKFEPAQNETTETVQVTFDAE